jgi:hypothetical protein
MHSFVGQRWKHVLVFAVVAAALSVGAARAVGAIGSSGIPDAQGIFHACVNNASGEVKLVLSGTQCATGWSAVSWNQAGPAGEPGAPGPPGPSFGPNDAFSVEANSDVVLPRSFASVLDLDVPAGNYVVSANISVSNFSYPNETLPVNCAIVSPTESSVPYSARIDPFNSATAQGASTATIALTLTTKLAGPGTLQLDCQTNSGDGQTAFSESRQMTAIQVENLTEHDLAP